MKKKHPGVIISGLLLLFVILLVYFEWPKNQLTKKIVIIPTPTPQPVVQNSLTPFPTGFTTYEVPKIEQKQVYKIAMIGDSMTAALGPHGGGLSEYMNKLYMKNATDPQRIIIDNYARSSNILAVESELSQKAHISEYTFGPLVTTDYDLILVESYAYNPLSQYGLKSGIDQQNLALDRLMERLIYTHPHSVIAFVATISPNVENYAKNSQKGSSGSGRSGQADERIAYIKNHISYAEKHNIPLINIYAKSLTPQGDGNMDYINPTDDIHPSFAGVTFIGKTIGDYIHDHNILPQ